MLLHGHCGVCIAVLGLQTERGCRSQELVISRSYALKFHRSEKCRYYNFLTAQCLNSTLQRHMYDQPKRIRFYVVWKYRTASKFFLCSFYVLHICGFEVKKKCAFVGRCHCTVPRTVPH